VSIRRIFPIPTRIQRQPLTRRLTRRLRLVLIQIPRLHLRHLRMDWKRMTTTSRECILLAAIGHVSTYVPYLIAKMFHEWAYGNADWFISRNFHYQQARYWYLKHSADNALMLIAFIIICKVAAKFSDVLFLVFIVFLAYHIVDTILYWWDFNTKIDIYVDLLVTVFIFIDLVVSPYSPQKLGRIKSLF
jgi:hypothetical protein